MGWVIHCDCGTAIRAKPTTKSSRMPRITRKSKHSLTVTREQALALAERE